MDLAYRGFGSGTGRHVKNGDALLDMVLPQNEIHYLSA